MLVVGFGDELVVGGYSWECDTILTVYCVLYWYQYAVVEGVHQGAHGGITG